MGYQQELDREGVLFVDLRSTVKAVPDAACVVVIDDDQQVRESLGRLLRAAGLHCRLFATISEFLTSEPPGGPTCLVLDIRLQGESGLDLQRDLAAANSKVPIVFITAHADVPTTVQALKGGAIEFLTKPFREQDLLDAINAGLIRDREWREDEKALRVLRERFEELTPRERAILFPVVEGRLNKQIAGEMGITETTVKVHRRNMMKKMRAASVSELTRMVDRLRRAGEALGTLAKWK